MESQLTGIMRKVAVASTDELAKTVEYAKEHGTIGAIGDPLIFELVQDVIYEIQCELNSRDAD